MLPALWKYFIHPAVTYNFVDYRSYDWTSFQNNDSHLIMRTEWTTRFHFIDNVCNFTVCWFFIIKWTGWIFKQFHPRWKFKWFVMICMFHGVFEMGFTSNFIKSGFYDFIFLEYVLTVAPKVFGEFSSWFITFLCFFLYFFLIKLETYRISSSLLLFDLSSDNAFLSCLLESFS